ncbi:hypothetical protein [Albirhodobacter sp. R86504]|uniref:hypothetical protein n=1 Tax=Albirhodobacter sp. R86504 TaxID=3093848 RepID=UPI0036716300
MIVHHLLASAPFASPLNAALSRSLGRSRAQMARAGFALNGAPTRAKVVVSEKLFGYSASGFENFFSNAVARAAVTAGRLDGPIKRLVIQATPQSELFPALWRGIAARAQVDSFESHKDKIFGATRGWAELIEDLVNVIEPAEVVVLTGKPSQLAACAELVPGARIDIDNFEDPAMPDTALAMIQRLYTQGQVLPPRQVLRLQSWHARLPQCAPLAAFTQAEAAYLDARFADDMDRVSCLGRVRIVGDFAQAGHANTSHIAAQ